MNLVLIIAKNMITRVVWKMKGMLSSESSKYYDVTECNFYTGDMVEVTIKIPNHPVVARKSNDRNRKNQRIIIKVCLVLVHEPQNTVYAFIMTIFDFSGKKKRGSVTEDRIKQHKRSGSTGWQTLVLFTVNFKRLNVHMNMGNVMGNVM